MVFPPAERTSRLWSSWETLECYVSKIWLCNWQLPISVWNLGQFLKSPSRRRIQGLVRPLCREGKGEFMVWTMWKLNLKGWSKNNWNTFSYAVLYLDTFFKGSNIQKFYCTLHSTYVHIKLHQELFENKCKRQCCLIYYCSTCIKNSDLDFHRAF